MQMYELLELLGVSSVPLLDYYLIIFSFLTEEKINIQISNSLDKLE